MRLWGRHKGGDGHSKSSQHHHDDKLVVKHEDPDYFYDLEYTCKIDHSPDDIYNLLTRPEDRLSAFKNVTGLYRTVLEEDSRGRRKLAVGLRANVRLLIVRMQAEIHSHVWEDDKARTIRSSLIKSSNMQRFSSGWSIGPYPSATAGPLGSPGSTASAAGSPAPTAQGDVWGHQLATASAGLHRMFNPGSPAPAAPAAAPAASESLIVYHEAVLPKGHIPEFMRGLVQGMCAKQARNVISGVRGELDRRREARLRLEAGEADVEEGKARGRRKGANAGQGASLGDAPLTAAPAACLSASPLHAAVSRGLEALWEATEPFCINIHITLGEPAAA
ncbi:hypothetical protein HYH03_002310 [Edaphochlamys debaryana]|uniref:Uncharacterized protein n=1 Tax=Edaphochlamys debaryana TaxID=47281 RepID=A0A835YLS3_9CHLO|nr:hypothetical protein HYH03_002310 [Edaphochlamys debaryana]|eukprot:KAG2500029.1 hypothetical protein HYH03_002310 [Edaphochlamys debaryana]